MYVRKEALPFRLTGKRNSSPSTPWHCEKSKHKTCIRNSFCWHKYCIYYFLRLNFYSTFSWRQSICGENNVEIDDLPWSIWLIRSSFWLSLSGWVNKNSELPLRQATCNICWHVFFPFKYSTDCTDKRQIRLCIRFTRALPPCLWTPACILHFCLKLLKN